MKIDEIQILNYVEHKLDAPTRAAFEKIMENDAELQKQVRAIKASQLPYDAAFAAEKIPDVPERLQEQLEQLSSVSFGTSVKQVFSRSQRWLMFACLCLAFITGSLVTLGFNSIKSGSEYELSAYGNHVLIDAMIQYQALYSRATVETVRQSFENANILIEDFNQRGKYKLVIPDFSGDGYEFRRAQELAFYEQAIIQMVYLPTNGKPLALCVTKVAIPNQGMKHYQSAGINSILWVKQGLSYMLMGDYTKEELESLYKSLVI